MAVHTATLSAGARGDGDTVDLTPRLAETVSESGLGDGAATLSVSFVGGELALGTWQQVVPVDFDNRPRNRTIVVQIVGELLPLRAYKRLVARN